MLARLLRLSGYRVNSLATLAQVCHDIDTGATGVLVLDLDSRVGARLRAHVDENRRRGRPAPSVIAVSYGSEPVEVAAVDESVDLVVVGLSSPLELLGVIAVRAARARPSPGGTSD
jgi:hypothetical protein